MRTTHPATPRSSFFPVRFARSFAIVAVLLFIASAARLRAQSVAVLTQHDDNARTGMNLKETILNTANVNSNSFGLLFTRPVDDQIYAQPLIATNVSIPGKGTHNLVIVVTVNDTIYAYDADDATVTAPYWTNSFISAPNVVPPANTDLTALGACGGNYVDFAGRMGIVSTPVIDPVAGTVYLVARTKEFGTNFVQRLHALDLTTGQERPNSPVIITAKYAGSGAGSVNNVITFDPIRQNQRSALLLLNGTVYIAWTSHCDLAPYHGWIMGYDATNLNQVVVFNDDPTGYNCGIWMSGQGPAADANGNIYVSTGNGSIGSSTDLRDPINRGESFLKLTRNGTNLTVASWFTPAHYQTLENSDLDLGSSGLILIPGTSLAFSGGKEGVVYLVNRDNMGGLTYASTDTNVIQTFSVTSDQIHGGMVWWDGPGASYGYLWPSSVYLQQYTFSRALGRFVLPAVAQSPTAAPAGQPGGMLAVSANGTNAGSGIVWALHQLNGDANHTVLPGILHAYNAQNVSQELWNSQQNSARDAVGNFAKFDPPTVANGKVYVATFSGKFDVYGTTAGWVTTPTISPNGGVFTNSVTVTLSNTTPGSAIYYTLDGTAPTTNSLLYTGPFVLTANTAVEAKGFEPGAVNSTVALAVFTSSASFGTGTGLKGAYYSSQLKTFNGSPTLTRTDAVVNFNWGTGSPAAGISVDSFTVRWTGAVQPPISDTYTFYATTDDGVRLWINNQLVIDNWVDGPATQSSGSITLVGEERYNIRMEYYEDTGSASASLAWSTPVISQAIIPQNALYPVTNPPPVVSVVGPTNNSTYTASASVTINASAAAPYNTLSNLNFYANNTFIGSVSNNAGGTSNLFTLTVTGLAQGSYALQAVASDLTGLSSTSAPVNITVNAGSGSPYGLTTRTPSPAFYNMPGSYGGPLPPLLSQTGVFTNTPAMNPAAGLVPYSVNVPLWSDGAVKTRYLAVPNSGAPYTPDEQINFAPTGEWTFPAGTIFVKTFQLATNETDPNLLRRLETRLLVRDTNGAVYGVTYKWRPDNSEADLLTGSTNEDIAITTASGSRTQTWYYPSPSDCLVCHNPAANYVLGVKTRQLNGNLTYDATGQTDNQLRTLNRLGLLNPAINESAIAGYSQLTSLTNTGTPLVQRFRSYIDANCAQCHRPGGPGPTMDARYDTPLTNQNIINAVLSKGDLGYDNAVVVKPLDVWRSVLYDRMDTTDPTVKMPKLARNLIDTNAVQVTSDWINSLTGPGILPALAPPVILPAGGSYASSVELEFTPPDTNALLYYTLDSTLPTTNSLLYTGPFNLTSNATVRVNAFETGYANSIAVNAVFSVDPLQFTSVSLTNGTFQLYFAGSMGKTYVLYGSTNLTDWSPLATNIAPASVFEFDDTNAGSFAYRFYRSVELP